MVLLLQYSDILTLTYYIPSSLRHCLIYVLHHTLKPCRKHYEHNIIIVPIHSLRVH